MTKPFNMRYSRSTGMNRLRKGIAVSKVGQLRRFDYGEDWREIARERRRMDGNRCTSCGATERLQVHHRTPLTMGGSNKFRNLTTLCESCHAKEHTHSHMFYGGFGSKKGR